MRSVFPLLLFTFVSALPASAIVTYEDLTGSSAGSFTGEWVFEIETGGNSIIGIRIPDPTWLGTRIHAETHSTMQEIAEYRIVADVAPCSLDTEGSTYGYNWFYYCDPPDPLRIHVQISGSAGTALCGLDPTDYRDPSDPWCQGTESIFPEAWYPLACQIEGDLDDTTAGGEPGSLCGNEGLVQGVLAWVHDNYPGESDCRQACEAAAGLLRSKGIPTSINLTYQLPGQAIIGSNAVTWFGGLHCQVSAWNWASAEWERCDARYASNFALPFDISVGDFLDPAYISPALSWSGDGTDPILGEPEVPYGIYGDNNVSFGSFQERYDDILGMSLTLATLCFADYPCGKAETMGCADWSVLVGIPADGRAERRPTTLLLEEIASPCRGVVRVAPIDARTRVVVYDVAGRLVEELGMGKVRSWCPPRSGVYLIRAVRGDRQQIVRRVVVR